MQATPMVEALKKLRDSYENPPSDMHIIRTSLMDQVASMGELRMPPLLNQTQRKVFVSNIDKVSEFLETEDGADAVELLVNAFTKFTEDEDD